jgi:AmmeMemoRadiSam system protein B
MISILAELSRSWFSITFIQMRNIRPPAVAGTFYPRNADQLNAQVHGYLSGAKPARNTPTAIIAPHAGYMYSGPIAGSAYAPLLPLSAEIHRVVLLGPAHREYVNGIAASTAEAFKTPLGDIALDLSAIRTLVSELDFVEYNDSAHELEHSLEVQLPFLQVTLRDFRLIPLAVGGARPDQVEELLEKLDLDSSSLLVISSDLSHFHAYADAQQIDRYTTQKIEALDPTGLSGKNACGQRPVCGLLRYAVNHGLRCEVLDVRNSGDTAGDRDRVVGYGAYLFYRQRQHDSA